MHEVQVNVEDGWGFRLFGHNVRVPDFLEECFWHKFLSECQVCEDEYFQAISYELRG